MVDPDKNTMTGPNKKNTMTGLDKLSLSNSNLY